MPTTSPDTALQLGEEADIARREGRYAASAAIFHRALAMADEQLASNDPRRVQLLNRWGVLGKFRGEHDVAESAYARALEIEVAQRDPRPATIATLLHNLAGLAHAQSRFCDAEGLARRGLELRRRICAPDDPQVAADEGALAAILVDRGEFSEAMTLATHARGVLSAHKADWATEAVAALAVLATVAHRVGDLELAVALYDEVVREKESVLGSQHPELVPTLNNRGVLDAQLGRMQDAADDYRRAERILDGAGISAHPYRQRIGANTAALEARTS